MARCVIFRHVACASPGTQQLGTFLVDLKRTHDCGALRASDAGKRVVLFGWVAARRDHGGCVFIDLRDRGGITQIVFEPATRRRRRTRWPASCAREFCIGVAGVVVERGGHKNPNLPTGDDRDRRPTR